MSRDARLFSEQSGYTVELFCDYSQWWRYNLYVVVIGYDHNGERVCYRNLVDRVYDIAEVGVTRSAPADYDPLRPVKLESGPCAYADVYLYVVPNTFPDSEFIKDSPAFNLVLQVSAGGRVLERSEHQVNQWGGLTVVAHRIDQGE